MEPSKRRVEAVVRDLIVVDVQAVEDRLVEQTALLIIAAAVQLLGVLQQLQADLDESGAVGEVLGRRGQPLGQASPLAGDHPELGFDLQLRDVAVGGQLDEVLLAGVQRL